jgi:hypothetical protein
MKLCEFLGLSEYDMNIVFYYTKAVVLIEFIFTCLMWCIHWSVSHEAVFLFGLQQIYSLFLYIIGFLTGIMIARTNVHENSESLCGIHAATVVKHNAVNTTDTILSVT